MEISLLDLDDVIKGLIDFHLQLFDQSLVEFEHQEGCFHMLPGNIEVDGFDRHALVELLHDGTLVMVGSAEDIGEELDHGAVQLGNV